MNEPASNPRLLRRPTTAETERIARECPAETLSVPMIVAAIRRVSDAFAAGILSRKENAAS